MKPNSTNDPEFEVFKTGTTISDSNTWLNSLLKQIRELREEKKNPPAVKEISALIPVTKDTVDAFAKNWDKWLPK